MAKEAWLELPPMRDDYQLAIVDTAYMAAAVKPKQFIHIDETECILCAGCVDICPWKCIHILSPDVITEAFGVDDPNDKPENQAIFVIDDTECTRCKLCVDRCPTNVITIGKFGGSTAELSEEFDAAPWEYDTGSRDAKSGQTYGVRW
ncbi:MAG: 4Fe-4S dicluster domain-containing protein [Actinomycetota bacterium]|nr:4Fe-4S dicluster domain-containing protein [Actinomycetota bacterium]MDK1017717.1 4Fe-4S dicluster domain-containing protein [Actinomycetota bacterium]MDK1026952.1 4Fe-4S dicluster domain-containing protein [Actinomycetota bacterium]MDK1038309.1 4Fe-4S dicluster domain-containing protein [Actinomycetota bacterium]MDK1097038.1 4Fe-4S dicluster domain-containing protein [Actinomycetota bacterium]